MRLQINNDLKKHEYISTPTTTSTAQSNPLEPRCERPRLLIPCAASSPNRAIPIARGRRAAGPTVRLHQVVANAEGTHGIRTCTLNPRKRRSVRGVVR